MTTVLNSDLGSIVRAAVRGRKNENRRADGAAEPPAPGLAKDAKTVSRRSSKAQRPGSERQSLVAEVGRMIAAMHGRKGDRRADGAVDRQAAGLAKDVKKVSRISDAAQGAGSERQVFMAEVRCALAAIKGRKADKKGSKI